MAEEVSKDRRKEAFAALVAAQDSGTPVVASRAKVAAEFELTVEQVVSIEGEGMKAEWPPLA